MGKSDLTALLILVVVIEISMYVFLGVTTTGTSLFDLINSGALFNAQTFWAWITTNLSDVVGIVGVGTIVVGTALATKNDFAIYAGISFVFLSYAKVFIDLQTELAKQINSFMTLEGGGLLSMIIVMPIVVLYIVTILKFWRGTD